MPGPTLILVGDTWIPNVDGAGRIATSDFDQLPLNRWVQAGTNRLDDVVPYPRYPTYLGHPDGSPSIVSAWCGAAWDYRNQRMYLSGGGHADSHLCENGIYVLSVDTLRFDVAVPRAPASAAQYWHPTLQYFAPGMIGGGGNAPLVDGSVPASHTYDTLVWIPANVMGNQRGGIMMFHDVVGVVDLDTATYDTAHFSGPSPVDLSYKICEMDGWNLIHPRASFYYRLWDMRPTTRSATLWSADSRGAYLRQFNAGANVVYNHKMMVRMPHRREFVMLSAAAHTRCRYGQGFDSGNRQDWTAFHDRITFSSPDGSDAIFNSAANWQDSSTDTPLFAAGGAYDYWGNCIWVQSNLTGGDLYKIDGIAGNNWTVQRVPNVRALSSTVNGTYHRCQVFVKGTATCLLRVSSTTGYPEVCRVA